MGVEEKNIYRFFRFCRDFGKEALIDVGSRVFLTYFMDIGIDLTLVSMAHLADGCYF